MSIRDDFFANQAVAALWDVAVSIKRGNPLPLDSNSVFESYTKLETYVAGPLAYPGQIVSVVNADSTDIYYLDQELAIKSVGSVPTADDKSIVVNNGILSLHDYGTAYYKYIAESTDEEGTIIPAHYEKVEVNEETPWISGLEPRVVAEGEDFVIGWYEPNPTTIEGVQNQIVDLQKTVENITTEIGVPATEEGVTATGLYAELDKKANKDDVYSKEETDTLIASVDHLKRKIFATLEEANAFIAENAETANQYIYMIPSGLQLDSNRYYEYLYVDNSLEQVGNWEVDLDDYFTENELKTYLEDYYTETEIDNILEEYAKSSVLEGYYTTDQVDNLLAGYYTTEQVNNLLDSYDTSAEVDTKLTNYVEKVEGKSLVSDTEITKLASVQANAEPNYITSVEEDELKVENGLLSVISIVPSKVTGLEDLLNNKADASALDTLSGKVSTLEINLGTIDTKVTNLQNSLNNYVTLEVYNAEIAEIKDAITWKEITNN